MGRFDDPFFFEALEMYEQDSCLLISDIQRKFNVWAGRAMKIREQVIEFVELQARLQKPEQP